MSFTPKTAGISRLRDIIAACEVLPPVSEIIPLTNFLFNIAVSLGVNSWQIKTTSVSRLTKSGNVKPKALQSILSLISKISVALSLK